MKSEFGEVSRNLALAETYVERAAQCGAKLVLLPEFMPSGYAATETIWSHAEPKDGRSVTWLLNTARRHQIYLGFTFVESDGTDFYNTFVLSGPDGVLLGQVRKNPPCSKESYYFKAGSGSHVIETDLGRVGVGICYENLLFGRMRAMHEADVAFILLPASAGKPLSASVASIRKTKISARSIFVSALGVPVIIANAAAEKGDELPEDISLLRIGFPSSSSIVDGNGDIKAEGGNGEGIIVGEVSLDAHAHHLAKPKRFGIIWAVPVPRYAIIWWIFQKMGEYSYLRNSRRKACAKLFGKVETRPCPATNMKA